MPAVVSSVVVTFVSAALLCLPALARAQVEAPLDAATQGAFPDAAFLGSFRKYVPPSTVFSPFYSWDAHLGVGVTVFRRGPHAADFTSIVQTVGTESFGTRVSVGGTGYIIGISYVRAVTADAEVSAGIRHLSSHLARDLDERVEEERRQGSVIPDVDDPAEFNVAYLRVRSRFPEWALAPELDVAVAPLDIRFTAPARASLRPLYVATRFTLWKPRSMALVAETTHEVGTRPFSYFLVALQMFPRDQREGQLQVYVGGSPGGSMHVSPYVGGVRDGVAFGVRLAFRR